MNSNKRIFVLSIFGSFLVPASAQMWCPPGAVWEDNVQGWAWEGCETRTYTGDTLIDGQICQTIHVWKSSYSHLSQETTTAEYDVHTRLEDGVVYALWQSEGTWFEDTLYWFTAPVGARWNLVGAEEMCPVGDGWVEVLSIEDREINGLTLQARLLGSDHLNGEMLVWGELIDRIGAPLLFIPPPCALGEVSGVTVSYRDDMWDGFDTGVNSYCELFPNAVHEIQGMQLHTLSFAPDARTLTIHARDGTRGQYTLHDVRGTVLQEGRYTEGTTTVHVGQLPTAIYLMRLTSSTGEHKVLKFHVP